MAPLPGCLAQGGRRATREVLVDERNIASNRRYFANLPLGMAIDCQAYNFGALGLISQRSEFCSPLNLLPVAFPRIGFTLETRNFVGATDRNTPALKVACYPKASVDKGGLLRLVCTYMFERDFMIRERTGAVCRVTLERIQPAYILCAILSACLK